WNTKDVIAIGRCKACLETRLRLDFLVGYIFAELSGVGADFAEDLGEGVWAFDFEFPLPETFENPIRVLTKKTLILGAHPAIEGKASAVDLPRRHYHEASLSRGPSRIQIEITQLATVTFVAHFDFAAVNISNIDAKRDEAELHTMSLLECVRRSHCQVSERARIGEVKLD